MRKRRRGKDGKESIKSMDMVLTKHTKAEGVSWKRECKKNAWAGRRGGMLWSTVLQASHSIIILNSQKR